MENFLFGVQALFELMKVELSLLYYSPIIRGFLAGYIVATVVYGFLETSKRHRERVCGEDGKIEKSKNLKKYEV